MDSASRIGGETRTWLRALLLAMGFFSLWLAAAASQAAPSADEARLVDALRQGGVMVLIRHSATEPGVGDPPGFLLGDCGTQRNFSQAGREQARRIGEWFKSHGIVPTSVRASPWCRTRETAKLAFERSADWTALSNILGDRSRQGEHATQVRDAIARVGAGEVQVLVSHGVTINAFIDVYLSQGELVVVRPVRPVGGGGDATGKDGFAILGRVLVP